MDFNLPYICCKTLIDFEAPSDTKWRKCTGSKEKAKPVEELITDIVRFREEWRKYREKCREDPKFEEKYEETKQLMRIKFITQTNRDEDIGTKEEKETEEVLKKKDCQTDAEIETTNQSNAILWLREIARKEQEMNPDCDTLGLMDVPYLKELHEILMDKLIHAGNTQAGEFSLSPRLAEYKGEKHFYPNKESVEDWELELSSLFDRYNGLLLDVKTMKDKKERLMKLFKCAAFLLFNLVSLHPFSDGNGRLCRILASYTLSILTPFESAIYNIYNPSMREDYIQCIVDARKSEEKHPTDLTTLIIESNWSAWKHFLNYMDN